MAASDSGTGLNGCQRARRTYRSVDGGGRWAERAWDGAGPRSFPFSVPDGAPLRMRGDATGLQLSNAHLDRGKGQRRRFHGQRGGGTGLAAADVHDSWGGTRETWQGGMGEGKPLRFGQWTQAQRRERVGDRDDGSTRAETGEGKIDRVWERKTASRTKDDRTI